MASTMEGILKNFYSNNIFYIFSRFRMGMDRFCQLLATEVPVWMKNAYFCSGRKWLSVLYASCAFRQSHTCKRGYRKH
jgi:hypothetical protein